MARVTGQRGRNLKTKDRNPDRERKAEIKGEKATGLGAEREEWIRSNRGPDRAQWKMEKKVEARSREEGGGARQRDIEEDQKKKPNK